MPTAIHRKPNGTGYVYSAIDNEKFEREYPGCETKSQLHEAIRNDAGLGPLEQVPLAIMKMSITKDGWIHDDCDIDQGE